MSDRPASRLPLIVGLVVVAAVVVGGFVLLGGEDPDEVDAQAALEQADAVGSARESVSDADDEVSASDTASDDGASLDVAATTWTVDTEAVAYSFAEGAGSFLGFRIDEELSSVGETEAVGRTPEVEGSFTIDGTTVTDATFSGDARALTTDRSQRDSRARAALGDGILVFALTEPIDLGSEPTPGETVAVDATGELTINGVTQVYTVPLEASLSDSGLLVVTSSFRVSLEDHDVTAPRAGPVLSVSDVATVEAQLFLTEG